jgi:RimJ/RimL family protein N-acetyltransferase
MTFPERVQTARLTLRRWRASDRDAFAAIWAAPDVARWLSPDAPADEAVARARFEHHVGHWEEYGFGLWASEDRASGQVVGWVGPAHPTFLPELAEEVEVGWTLRRRFWGRGLATEGARVAVSKSFECLGLDEVVSLIDPANSRSIAVAERLGMTDTRTARHPGTGIDLRVYVLSCRAGSD